MILKEVLDSLKERMNQKEKQKKAMINIMRKKGKEMRNIKKSQQNAFLDKTFKRIKGEDEQKVSPSSKHPSKAFNRK
tara:strand:+ start:796 stop:1026 length:231 start_codon:yes stop_codon:yes gene_type:complete